MKNNENAFRIVTARHNIYRLALKVKKSRKFITKVKHLVQKEIVLLFLSYDILSKKFIEDSVPITTTPETLKKNLLGIFMKCFHFTRS